MQNTLPAAWNDATALEGVDLVAKQELIGVPFLITAVWFETNKSGVEYSYVEAEHADGTPFTFNDSSTGVRAQLIEHLERIGKGDAREDGTVLPLRLVVPRGLRVSEFEVTDERRRTKMAKTFYLTTAGVRRGDVQGTGVQPGAKSAARKATGAAKPAA